MSKPTMTHLYTFPPFPKLPEGVTIIPFKDFQPDGIQIQVLDDGIEKDALGMPTVALRVKHNTDECKTDAELKRKKRYAEPEIATNPDGSTRKQMWYEQWEAGESLRYVGGYDPHLSRADRIHEATSNFNRRPWPPVNTQVRAQWDQFQLFVGLLTNIPIWSMKTEDKEDEEMSDDADDADDDAVSDGEPDTAAQEPRRINVNMTQVGEGGGGGHRKKRPRPRPPYANYGKKPVEVHNQDEIQDLLAQAREEKEEHLMEFLNDPAKRVQIFLSSYMRRQGLHFADRNLDILPRLLNFYIRFLIGNLVLPESERGLNRALEIIELARQELPLTSKIAKTLPDNFSRACEECYDVKSIEYKLAMTEVYGTSEQADPSVSTSTPGIADGTEDVEMEEISSPDLQTTPKSFDLEDGGITTEAQDQEVFEESLKSGNIRILSDPTATDPFPTSEANFEAPPPDLNDNTWGDVGSWGSDMPTVGSETWDAPKVEWIIPDPENLMKFLGPTVLPLTHTSGVVEWSVRRIKSVTLPPSDAATPATPKRKVAEDADIGPDAEAVEEELERNLARVVLEPWLEWEDPKEEPQACKPRILASSKGKVLSQVGVNFDGDTRALAVNAADESSDSKVHLHDPLKDEIMLLVEPESAGVLRVGMGLGGSWVQLARIADLQERETGSGAVAGSGECKSNSKKNKKSVRRFWYVNELMVTLTSYHLQADG